MDSSQGLMLFLLLFLIILYEQRKKKIRMARYLKMKYGKERAIMGEEAKRFIGKECTVYLLSGEIYGTILEVTDHGILLKNGRNEELLNLDFVMRICEHAKKNSKKKAALE